MTVEASDTIDRDVIAGVGPYPYSFRIFDDTDLQVTVCSTDTPPIPSLLTHLTHYTVSGANEADGGAVTLTADVASSYAGYTLDIRSNTPNTQPTSVRNAGRFLPEIHEDIADRVTREIQDERRRGDAAIHFPDNEILSGEVEPAEVRKGKYLFWDATTGAISSALSLTGTVLTQIIFNAYYALTDDHKRQSGEITAGVTPTNYAYLPGHLWRYLSSFTTDSTDCTAAIQSMLSVMRQGIRGYVPKGIHRYTSTMAFDTVGMVLVGESMTGTVFKKVGNFVGMEVTAASTRHNFTLDRTGADSSSGITYRGQPRVDDRDIIVQNQGLHGLWIQEASLSSFENIQALSNGGDGVRLDATVAPLTSNSYVNANYFRSIDSRGNAGHGFNVVEGFNNFGYAIVSQNNTGDGIRLDSARANTLTVYAEANTGAEVLLTNNANCRGNVLHVLEGTVSDSSLADSNEIKRANPGGVYEAFVRQFRAMKLIIPEIGYDGVAYQGTLDFRHIGNREFALTHDGFSGSQTLRVRNAQTGGVDFITDRIQCDGVRMIAAAPTVTAGQVGVGSTIATTVGGAGGASALPATPRGYWIINVDGSTRKVAFYDP